jgi:hypothetical protein
MIREVPDGNTSFRYFYFAPCISVLDNVRPPGVSVRRIDLWRFPHELLITRKQDYRLVRLVVNSLQRSVALSRA